MADTFGVLAGSLALENKPFHLEALARIKRLLSPCHGYIAYKLTRLGRVSDEDVPSFLIVSKEHGILLLDLVEERIVEATEKDGYELWKTEAATLIQARNSVLDLYEDEVIARLKNDVYLYDRRSRSLRVPIASAIFFCRNSDQEIASWWGDEEEYHASPLTVDELEPWLGSLPGDAGLSDRAYSSICALLEGTYVYHSQPSFSGRDELRTRNDFIQRSLRVTFKQDEAQRVASMQLPSGPQRIRGLAGTGKTIVLSLKAAITHARFEDFKILYLFNTQSLYQNVQSLIARHYTLQAKKAPDFIDHLHVFHAWGGKQRPGLYSNLCDQLGMRPITWGEVRGMSDGLQYIYRDLLKRAGSSIPPTYDLVLIDEAQDFPDEVFQVAYKLAKGEGANKRIIWAYDEFQSLRDTQMKGPSELFGLNLDGRPNVPDSALEGFYPGDIPKDFVLPNCYRTPRPVLMTAHGVAMGLYTETPNEMFYNRNDWEALGYNVLQPQSLFIEEGDLVEIERGDQNSKNILENLLRNEERDPLRLVRALELDSVAEQLKYIAEKIKWLIEKQEVAPEEIVVINLQSRNNKEEMLSVQRALTALGVPSVIPGYVESADVFKPKGFVTITTPFRAKGNEANIVFVMNAQGVSRDVTLRMRNAFFVALTRSRGWCYITGVGAGARLLVDEIKRIKSDIPRFNFVCPSPGSVRKSKSFLSLSDKQATEYERIAEILRRNPELKNLIMDDFAQDAD